jgi:hypothetical protein
MVSLPNQKQTKGLGLSFQHGCVNSAVRWGWFVWFWTNRPTRIFFDVKRLCVNVLPMVARVSTRTNTNATQICKTLEALILLVFQRIPHENTRPF